MPTGINVAMDIIAAAGITFYVSIIVNLPFVHVNTHSKDKAGHGALSALVILARYVSISHVVRA